VDDFKETAWDHVAGEKFATFSTSEKKWIKAIEDLKRKYPSEVDIRVVNNDGSLVARLPASWFKIRPKKQTSMTQEQKDAARARLETARQKRLSEAKKNQGGE